MDADISQYDLAKRGFCAFEEKATEDMAKSLNEEWVKQAMEHFAGAVIPARGIREKLVSNYYKTLVDRMDTDHNGRLSVDEILRAMTYPELDIQDIAARLVIKHDSEWYGGSKHQKWEKVLKNCDSLRVKYVNKWLDSMEWMSHVPPFDKGEPIWHMHPVMFLDALSLDDEMDIKWLTVPKGQLTFDAEGNDKENSIYFSRHPHVPNNKGVVIGISGVTFGRGLDLGQQSEDYIKKLFLEIEKNASPLSDKMKQWLLGSVGLQGSSALDYCLTIDSNVPKSEQNLTRKQQYFLFLAVYEYQYKVTKRIFSNGTKINGVNYIVDIDLYPQNVQDILVDLTFRGDNSPRTRKYFIKDLNSGVEYFKSNISNNEWISVFHVPIQRFNSRKGCL